MDASGGLRERTKAAFAHLGDAGPAGGG
jgi:hypothetical protein